jgi:hypothetical protein
VVGSLFFPFVISTLLWLNNSRFMPAEWRSSTVINAILGAALALYAYLAISAL